MSNTLYRYRSFIWQHALADLRHRYAGTGMGVIWNVVHPLSLIAVYSVIFGLIYGNMAIEGLPAHGGFAIYLCAGFFPWMAFSDSINRGATAFSGNAAYLKKLPVPEQVFVAQSVASTSLTLIISFSLLTVISLALGLRPSIYWLLLPIPIILLQCIGFGIGLIVGTLNVFFTDIGQIVMIVLNVLFWLTPIVYLPRQVPKALNPVLMANPATPAVEAIHNLFLWHRLPDLWTLPALAAWAVVSILCGYFLLNGLRGEIRDVL